MASKSGSSKKSGSTRRGDAGDKDRLIAELKERVAVLESEFRLKQSDTISRDVIDRKFMGEYLVLFQRMVDKAADMVFLLGPMGRIQFVNEAACKALGYTREELQSMTVFDLNLKHHTDNWQGHEEELKKRGSLTFENVLKTRDNRLIPVEISATYARLGDKEYNYSFIRDTTERKRTEEALRESEAHRKVAEAVEAERRRLFEVLETLPAMICLLTPDYHVAFANRSFRERFGESHGRHCYEYCFGRAEPCEFCEAYKVLETGKPHYWEVTGPDGSMIDAYDFPFIDADGSPMILEMDIDVTERKRAEDALRDSEARLRAFLENSKVIGWMKDENGRYAYLSQNYNRRFNTRSENWQGKTDFEFWPRKIAEQFWKNDLAVLESGRSFEVVEEAINPDGSKSWWLSFKFPFRDASGKINVGGLAVDITERKRAEEALKESEAMLREIIDTSPIPMVVYREEKIHHINKKFVEAFGYTMADIPSIAEWWPLAYPDKAYCEFVKNRWYAAVDDAVKNKTSIVPQEAVVTCKDGSKKDVLSFFSSIGDMNLAILQDITERKRAEEKVSHLASFPSFNPNPIVETDLDGNPSYMNPSARTIFPDLKEKMATHPILARLKAVANELEAKRKNYIVREVTVDGSYYQETIHSVPDKKALRIYVLDITKRKLAEKALNAAKQQAELYVDLMGHDINNIHQAALGYLELARDMPGDARNEYLDKATEALHRSTQLISNVRKLQKFQDNSMQAHDMDMCAVLAGVHKEYAITPGKTITLNLNGFTHCQVRADDLLHDVFSNLVGNAVKHTGNPAHVSINLDTLSEDGMEYCRVWVDDDGPGISDESKKTLFNRSLKGTPRVKGMGLGLYIVKMLVEYYGGRVWAEDRIPGDHTKGARFVVMLAAVEK